MWVLAILALPCMVAAQDSDWVVLSVHAEADLSAGDGSANVSIRYAIGTTPTDVVPRDKPMRFELLGFGDATADWFTTTGGDTVELWPTHGAHKAASIYASESLLERNRGEVELSYRVEAAVIEEDGRLRARIPLLSGPTAPMGASGEFTARLVLPEGWTISEGFPSGLRTNDDGTWSVRLQVAPSMIGFRGRSDGAWRPSIPLAVDFVTLIFLVGFSFVGWRHLSDVARRARA